jgi:chaperonin cofactor prefoldin
MIDIRAKLVDALDHAQEYLDLAIKAQDRGEREFYERICELYMRIAQEFEALIDE